MEGQALGPLKGVMHWWISRSSDRSHERLQNRCFCCFSCLQLKGRKLLLHLHSVKRAGVNCTARYGRPVGAVLGMSATDKVTSAVIIDKAVADLVGPQQWFRLRSHRVPYPRHYGSIGALSVSLRTGERFVAGSEAQADTFTTCMCLKAHLRASTDMGSSLPELAVASEAEHSRGDPAPSPPDW